VVQRETKNGLQPDKYAETRERREMETHVHEAAPGVTETVLDRIDDFGNAFLITVPHLVDAGGLHQNSDSIHAQLAAARPRLCGSLWSIS
jgi:hypothetical protein